MRDAARRIMMMIARGILGQVNDASTLQTVAVRMLADEEKTDVERVQDYGFSSVPLKGADAVLVSVGGNRDHTICIRADDRRHRRRDLKPGDVVIYDNRGREIHLGEDAITIKAPDRLVIDVPEIEITGDITVTGDVIADGVSLKTHRHPENDGGGPTDQPIAGQS